MESITIFKVLTAPYAIIFHIAIFFVLNEFRYPRKKAAFLTVLLNIPVLIITVIVYTLFGSESGGQLVLLIYVIPQTAAYLAISRYRDGRFFSTYFFTSGIHIFIIQISNLLDYYSPYDNNIVMFLIRIILYPVTLLVMVKTLQKPHRRAMNSIHTGWNLFASVSVLYTLLLLIVFNFPNTLHKRPYDIPALLLIFVLMLLTNLYYIQTLLHQQDYYHEKEINQFLELQMKMMQQKIEQTAQTERNISIYRHDLRHMLAALSGMLAEHQTEAASAYIENNIGTLDSSRSQKWCKNPVLNAMFSAYFGSALNQGIKIEAELDIPDITEEEAAGLSFVFANAIENAIQAVTNLPPDERIIRTRALRYPKLMFSVSNPYTGSILFDEDGIPTSKKSGHGIGTRSILAYCEKNNAVCDFKTKGGWFTIRVVKN